MPRSGTKSLEERIQIAANRALDPVEAVAEICSDVIDLLKDIRVTCIIYERENDKIFPETRTNFELTATQLESKCLDNNLQDRIKKTAIKVGQSRICFDTIYFSKNGKCDSTQNPHLLRAPFPSEGSGLRNIHQTILQNVNDKVPYPIEFRLKTSEFKKGTDSNAECIRLEDRKFAISSEFLKTRDSELITLPDFDCLEATTLHQCFEKKTKKEKVKKNWNLGFTEYSGSLFGYTGEVECFWPLFRKKWFPNAKGLFMHSYSQQELLPIIQNKIVDQFEFDWIYWSGSHVTVFKVGMKETNKFEDTQAKIKEKVKKAFYQYFPVFKILLTYLISSSCNSGSFETFFQQRFSLVLFIASANHKDLKAVLESENTKKWIDETYEDRKKLLLKNMYFVGKASDMSEDDKPFYKYNTDYKRVEETSILNNNNNNVLEDKTKNAMDELLELFALGYVTSEDNNVIGNFQR